MVVMVNLVTELTSRGSARVLVWSPLRDTNGEENCLLRKNTFEAPTCMFLPRPPPKMPFIKQKKGSTTVHIIFMDITAPQIKNRQQIVAHKCGSSYSELFPA